MPKEVLKYDSADQIPAGLKAYAKSDNSVEVWTNTDETAVAAELNPALAKNRDTILGEKDTLQTKYNALVQTSSQDDIDKAKILAELESAKKSTLSDDDKKILETVKKTFPQISASNAETEIPKIKTDAEKVADFQKKENHQKLFKASGYKNEKVFLDLIGNPAKMPNIDGEPFVEVLNEDGNSIEKVYVKVKAADGTSEKKSLADYVKTNPEWADYMSILNSGTNGGGNSNQTWIQQNQEGGGTQSGSILDKHIEARNKQAESKPNMLSRNAPSSQTQPPAVNQN